MLTLDATTRAAYDAATTAAGRAQAVLDALTGTVDIKVYNGSGSVMGSGTIAAPWAIRSANVLTVQQSRDFSVTTSGTPDSSWYLRLESGGKWVRGSFGLTGSGQDFLWSLSTWASGQLGTIGTATATSGKTTATSDLTTSWTVNGAQIVFGWNIPDVPYAIGSFPSTGGTYDVSQFVNLPPGAVAAYAKTGGTGTVGAASGLITVPAQTAGAYYIDIDLTQSGTVTWTPTPTQGTVRRVPSAYSTVQAAHDAASSGDTILIESDLSTTAAVATITKPLLIQGSGASRKVLDHTGTGLANDQGIFVVTTALNAGTLTIENLDFRGARAPVSQNGAGLRADPRGTATLNVRNCRFYDCEDGILTGPSSNDATNGLNVSMLVEFCEFDSCAVYSDPSYTTQALNHQAYIGRVGSLTVRYCQSRNIASAGHHFKLRAKACTFEYNRVDGGITGNGSCCVEFPNGGAHVVRGNLFVKGALGTAFSNTQVLSVSTGGSDGTPWTTNTALVSFNTFYSRITGSSTTFIQNGALASTCTANNNVFVCEVLYGANIYAQNFTGAAVTYDPSLMPNRASGDYRIATGTTGYGSVALASGVTAPTVSPPVTDGATFATRTTYAVQGAYEGYV